MEIPAVNLKAIVLVHWLLTTWAYMAWLPSSYAWGNFSMLAVGVWAVAHRDSLDAVMMFFIGMAVTVLTDIIHFGIYYPIAEGLPDRNRDTFRFSVGMAILSLLLKPVSCFFLYQMYRQRGGEYNVNFDRRVSTPQDNGSYQGKRGRQPEKTTYGYPSKDSSTAEIDLLTSIDEKLNKLDILDQLKSDTVELKTSLGYSHQILEELRTGSQRIKGFPSITRDRDSYESIDQQDQSTSSSNA